MAQPPLGTTLYTGKQTHIKPHRDINWKGIHSCRTFSYPKGTSGNEAILQTNGFPAILCLCLWKMSLLNLQGLLPRIGTNLYIAVVGLAGLESRGGKGASAKCWKAAWTSKTVGSWLTSGRDTDKVLVLRNLFLWAATIFAAIAATQD